VRLARLTFTSVVGFGTGAAFAKLQSGARLWIDDYEISAASSSPNVKWMDLVEENTSCSKRVNKGLRESELGVGISVCNGTSLNVRDSYFCGTNGAAIEIAPNAKKVQLHRFIFTSCGRGS
jgi:hypothetical protein